MKSFRTLFFESSEEDYNVDRDFDVYEFDDEEAIDNGLSASDAAIMLGPLYHLLRHDERLLAVQEAAARLKPGGLLLAAGINRLSYLRDALRDDPADVIRRKHFHARFLVDGNLDPHHAPPIGHAHLTTPAEFRQLFTDLFDVVTLVGLESFASTEEARLLNLSHEEPEEWLDLIEATGRTPEGLAQSDHFLFVGRKR